MKKNYKFMTCHWENLIYLNFTVEPELLAELLPRDLEPDLLEGKAVISMVCFEFSKARLFGFKIPLHQYFPEINIRTYVKRKDNENVKGIYFISEMVPKLMTFLVGKFVYGEPFSLRNLKISKAEKSLQYKMKDSICDLNIKIEKGKILHNQQLTKEQEFVIARSFAFCGKRGKESTRYEVLHQQWNLIESKTIDISIKKIKHLNVNLQNILSKKTPESVYITDGSRVEVLKAFFI